MDLYAEMRRLLTALHDADIDYALCGAIALAIHGVPRATRDLDLMARPDDLDAVRGAIGPLG